MMTGVQQRWHPAPWFLTSLLTLLLQCAGFVTIVFLAAQLSIEFNRVVSVPLFIDGLAAAGLVHGSGHKTCRIFVAR